MVGLRNRSTWEPLLLKASCIKSCANGCALGITAQLTYANADLESVEGVFVYPLGEKEVVVGYEAVIAGRLMRVQIQSRGKLKDCCLDCCSGPGPDAHRGNGPEWSCCGTSSLDMQCTNGEERKSGAVFTDSAAREACSSEQKFGKHTGRNLLWFNKEGIICVKMQT
uniref:VIT domain-containing protein n=1 Tax=Oryzias latipes TaxID=8090 RepID=A0A3P9I4Y1_ORYLA